MSTPPAQARGPAPARRGALRCPRFARLLSGQVVSQVGTQMNNTAEAWILYRLTHSALALGLQGLCFSLPIAVLPLLTGILADRYSRLTLVKATLAVEAGQAFALAAVAAAGDLRPWMLYLAAGTDACRLAVNIPAQSALIPNVVPADMLPSALALSSSTWSSSALAGPAVAGALLAVAGPALIFAVNGACTLIALGAVASLRGVAQPPLAGGGGFRQLTSGITYLRRHPEVRLLQGVLLAAMTGILGVETLLPVFAARTWPTGSAGYGLLRMAPGIAAVLAGLGLAIFPPAARRTVALVAAFAGAGAAIAGFAAAPTFILALLLLTAGSLGLTMSQVIAGTMVQQATPDAIRGRISALGSAGQNGLAGIAAAATAGLAARTGPGLAVSLLAATTASAGILLSLLAARAAQPAAQPVRTAGRPAGRR